MNEEIRLAIATAALQGILAHEFRGYAEGLVTPEDAAQKAFAYADALLEAARPRAPQAGGRLPLAEGSPASDADRGLERPSAAPEERRCPPVPPAPAPSRGEVPPSPPEPPPRCEAPDCAVAGKLRAVEALVDGVKRDVPILLCDLHFAGIHRSILLEWHRAYREALKATGKRRAREIADAL